MKRWHAGLLALVFCGALLMGLGSQALALSSGTPGFAAPESKAVQWLEAELAAQDEVLWVYKDFSDSLNHFTQKAWMGDSNYAIPEMNEAAEGRLGTTAIAAELDLSKHSWGGYLFTNGVLKAGETQPEADFGTVEAGVDLSGAARLRFYARGETGRERVEFFAFGLGWQDGQKIEPYPDSSGKITLGTVRLTTEWQPYSIELDGADLSRIGCGFGWVTNDVSNAGLKTVKFYVDEIRYEFTEKRVGPALLKSYENAKPGTEDAIINGFAYTYDNAVAAIALSRAGQDERARQLADALVYAHQHDRRFSDGRLRNAYAGGNPASFSGWQSAKAEAFARMPGFYDPKDKSWYEDIYAVSSSTGNMAWVVLALCEVYAHAPQRTEYLDAARGIGDLILTLKDEKGGFTGGFEGWDDQSLAVSYKSTEHNIDLVPAFERLWTLTGQNQYAEAAQHARAFVLSMYDGERGCFYTGTTADGITPNKDVLPLDCNTWAILALGDSFTQGGRVMDFVEANMAVDGGYDFNTDKDGVWFEGTAQAALAYQQLGDQGKYEQILAFLNRQANGSGSIAAADRDGVTTGFTVGGTDIAWKYGKRIHVGATAWLALAQLGENPFE